MNGRVYDPSIGRMISADPTIPDPLYSQAFNRYTYVYNNPLNATDPSGYVTTSLSYSGVEGINIEENQTDLPGLPPGVGFSCTSSACTMSFSDAPVTQQASLPPTSVSAGNEPTVTATQITPSTDVTPSTQSSLNDPLSAAEEAFMEQLTGVTPNGSPCDCQTIDLTELANPGADQCMGCDFQTGSVDWASIGSTHGATPAIPFRQYSGQAAAAALAGRRNAVNDMRHRVGAILGPIGIANSEIGTGLTMGDNFFVSNGFWRGSNGQLYSLGKYFGNQYGRTAAETAKIADSLRVLGKVSVFAGVAIGGVQWYGHVSQGNTAMAIRDSTDIAMGGVALDFPFGTAVAGVYFTGEFLYDVGGFDAYADGVSQNIAIQGPSYNSGPKY